MCVFNQTAVPFGMAVLTLIREPQNGKKMIRMENRIAAISILVSDGDSVEKPNALPHSYGEYVIGRMKIPCRQRGVNIICLAIDAPAAVRPPFITACSAYDAGS